MMTADMAAREHIAWCIGQGMTPAEVCATIGRDAPAATWAEAHAHIRNRWWRIGGKDLSDSPAEVTAA